MSIIATIMNTKTGQPGQKMAFGRMPKPERVSVAKPQPGKCSAPIEIWVSPRD